MSNKPYRSRRSVSNKRVDLRRTLGSGVLRGDCSFKYARGKPVSFEYLEASQEALDEVNADIEQHKADLAAGRDPHRVKSSK